LTKLLHSMDGWMDGWMNGWMDSSIGILESTYMMCFV
jgi:hypothetical protein